MSDATQQPSLWEHKIYGFLFIIVALLDLGLVAISAFPLDLLWPTLLIRLTAILGLLIVGTLVLRVRKPTTIVGLRIGTLIGLVAGASLGIFMAIAATGPNESILGVALYALLPLPILLFSPLSISIAFLGKFLFLPHILTVLLLGGYAFWMGKYSGSTKDSLRCTLYAAFAIELFTLLVGGIYSLRLAGAAVTITSYAAWSILFVAPLGQLVLYALAVGGIGALLSRVGRR